MKNDLVTYELDGPIALIGLNRPEKRNALSLELVQSLADAVTRAHSEAAAGVIFGHGAAFSAGLDLAEAAWIDALKSFDWSAGADWYILHQVSKVHTTMLCARLGIDPAKAPLTVPHYGNVGPAAVPITLAYRWLPRVMPAYLSHWDLKRWVCLRT